MAVLALITMKGDPDDLLDRYDRSAAEVTEVEEDGLILHSIAPTDEGVVMADVWDSRETLEKYMSHPDFVSMLDRFEFPEPEVTLYDIHNLQC
jgi:quinol monooxygenase YgiN